MARAKTVILPYLDVVERMLFVLSVFERGSAVSRSSLEYFENPVAWWLRRGAEQVIFLQPGRTDDIPPRGAEPDGTIAEKLTPADPTAREAQSGAFLAASCTYPPVGVASLCR